MTPEFPTGIKSNFKIPPVFIQGGFQFGVVKTDLGSLLAIFIKNDHALKHATENILKEKKIFFWSLFLGPHPWHIEGPRLGVESEP